jgi:hypothetical protein
VLERLLGTPHWIYLTWHDKYGSTYILQLKVHEQLTITQAFRPAIAIGVMSTREHAFNQLHPPMCISLQVTMVQLGLHELTTGACDRSRPLRMDTSHVLCNVISSRTLNTIERCPDLTPT